MAKYRKRRALATVVSTGILLSAVAIMGSMLTAWSNSIFATEQHEINAVYAEGVNKLNEYLVIARAVSFSGFIAIPLLLFLFHNFGRNIYLINNNTYSFTLIFWILTTQIFL